MTAQFARTPYRGRSGGSTIAEPHAALLIDFDNVTMGIRSDLTKELKNLLNSDIIKGKVAVQRAYADWRRYPQYIVPLAESSVDLIFAPAYGSAKKNATDIRLAIDALELVFTRPEIGTFILLSGDSDFSSLVLKLKEYGKYVIGVGIRESASDLLVQNCDEYYSYSALTGLTRAGDEPRTVSEDPWELVELALKQMIDNDDVMRSDRLKQVLLEMDPTFDEKALGFQKFNKFLQEAATRGLLSLRKQDNGQFEVGPPSADGSEPVDTAAAAEQREGRRRGRRGRGRRDDSRPREEREEGRPREERKDQLELTDGAPRGEIAAAPVAPPAVESAPPAAGTVTPAAAEERAPAPREETPREAAPRREPRPRETPQRVEPQVPAAQKEVPAAAPGSDLDAAYSLLRRAAADLVRKNGPAVRDSDVKRRMLELQAGWDETGLGFSKFSRFLRQAHDAQIITLHKLENGNYDVLLSDVPETEESRGRRDRGRGRERGGRGREDRPRGERPSREEEAPAAESPGAATPTLEQAGTARPRSDRQRSGQPEQPASAPATERPAAARAEQPATNDRTPEPRAAQPAAPAVMGFRRGSRGRGAPSGPPPLLEGQTARIATTVKAPEPAPVEAPQASAAPAAPAEPQSRPRKQPRKTAAKAAEKFNAAELGLPRDAAEVSTYIAANYKGVGPKSVQALIEKFGAGRVFEAFATRPDEVREVMGGARGDRLLDAWSADLAARRGGAPAEEKPARTPRKAAKKATRRGARKRTAKK